MNAAVQVVRDGEGRTGRRQQRRASSLRVVARSGRSSSERRGRGMGYFLRALSHPANILPWSAALGVACMAGAPWLVPLLLAADAGVIGLVARGAKFRDFVDEQTELRRRVERRRAREPMLAQMDEGYRCEFRRIDQLVESLRDARLAEREPLEAELDGRLDLDRLLDAYAELGAAHRKARELLSMIDSGSLQNMLESLERRRQSDDQLERSLAERRALVVSRRLAQRRAVERAARLSTYQLSLIAELVRLLYERALLPARAVDLAEEVEAFCAELQANDSCLGELRACGLLPEAFSCVPVDRPMGGETAAQLPG